MSTPNKRAKLEQDDLSPSSTLENQDSIGSSGSSASSGGTPKRKFNFWRKMKAESEVSEITLSSELDKDFGTLTIGRKKTKLQFRVTHASMRPTQHGIRLGVCGYDLKTQAKLFGFRKAAEKFFSILKVGEAYEISDFLVKQASNSGTPQIEIMETTECVAVPDTVIPKLDFNFLDINSIIEKYQEPPAEVRADFVGVVVRVSKLGTTRKGDSMRSVDLTDKTKENIPLKLWGMIAETVEVNQFDVVAIRQAAVRKFIDEIQLNHEYKTGVLVNPDIPEAEDLKEWFLSVKDDPMESDDDMMDES